jgi:ubiquitin C-terminal hydrolase
MTACSVRKLLTTTNRQGIGVLASLEKKLAQLSQSNQDFLNTLLQKLHSNLEGKFKKFVDEQLRAIEDTKVKINKRKGVISFFRIFPLQKRTAFNRFPGCLNSVPLELNGIRVSGPAD